MAKGKYHKWLEPDGLLLLSAWARDGCTDETIALKMDIALSTLYKWKLEHAEISDSLKKGKEVVDIEVENALLSNALKGDLGAQIFWLKNRKPEQWRDKPTTSTPNEDINDSIIAIADLIRTPRPNRELPNDE